MFYLPPWFFSAPDGGCSAQLFVQYVIIRFLACASYSECIASMHLPSLKAVEGCYIVVVVLVVRAVIVIGLL